MKRGSCQLQGGDPSLGPGLEDETSLALRSRPRTSLRYAAASSALKRRSLARTSTSSPRARSRANGRAGTGADDKVELWWSAVEQEGHVVADGGVVDEVVVVENEGDFARVDAQFVDQGDDDTLEDPVAESRRSSADAAAPGLARSTACST